MLSDAEQLNLINQYLAAAMAGKNDEALKIIQQLPMPPQVAKATKEVFGVEYLMTSGFDLSAAEAAYGKYWLGQ